MAGDRSRNTKRGGTGLMGGGAWAQHGADRWGYKDTSWGVCLCYEISALPPQARAAAQMGHTATMLTTAAAAPCESGSPRVPWTGVGATGPVWDPPAPGWVPLPLGGCQSQLQ